MYPIRFPNLNPINNFQFPSKFKSVSTFPNFINKNVFCCKLLNCNSNQRCNSSQCKCVNNEVSTPEPEPVIISEPEPESQPEPLVVPEVEIPPTLTCCQGMACSSGNFCDRNSCSCKSNNLDIECAPRSCLEDFSWSSSRCQCLPNRILNLPPACEIRPCDFDQVWNQNLCSCINNTVNFSPCVFQICQSGMIINQDTCQCEYPIASK